MLAKAEAGKDSEVFREAKKISRVRQAIPTPELDHVKQRRRGFAGDIGTDQSSCLRVSHLAPGEAIMVTVSARSGPVQPCV